MEILERKKEKKCMGMMIRKTALVMMVGKPKQIYVCET
jgi:hypothetical protein